MGLEASRLTMNGATEPGSGMCRKLSEKEGRVRARG